MERSTSGSGQLSLCFVLGLLPMVLVLFKDIEVKNKAMVVSGILVALDNYENNDPIGLIWRHG
jgi:hypothetical protein